MDSAPKPLILVVDDNHDNAEVLRQLLQTRGYDVVVAHGGDEALERFEAMHPSIVLLDVIMPGRNGWDVCRAMKEHATLGTKVRVIMVTGLDEVRERAEAARAGADDVIEKPIDFARLLRAVEQNAASRD